MRLQETCEFQADELASLIGVHYLWHTILLNCFINRFNTEIRMHDVREPEGQDFFAMPIDNGG
jgi:hypothetical protein